MKKLTSLIDVLLMENSDPIAKACKSKLVDFGVVSITELSEDSLNLYIEEMTAELEEVGGIAAIASVQNNGNGKEDATVSKEEEEELVDGKTKLLTEVEIAAKSFLLPNRTESHLEEVNKLSEDIDFRTTMSNVLHKNYKVQQFSELKESLMVEALALIKQKLPKK